MRRGWPDLPRSEWERLISEWILKDSYRDIMRRYLCYGVAAKYGLDRPEFYADLAKAFLMDKDAGVAEAKMAGYYYGVVLRK